MVVVDTKKDIADIQWSHRNRDVIFVAFSFSPQIQAIDLNSPSKPIAVLNTGKESSGGHKSLFLIPRIVSGSSIDERILSGTQSGYLRMWKSIDNYQRMEWEALADPLTASKHGFPVVSIVPVISESSIDTYVDGTFISLDAGGVLVMWNYKSMKKSAFGLDMSPTCIKRWNLFDLCVGLISSQENLSEKIKLIGAEVFDQKPYEYLVTFSSGDVAVINILNTKCKQLVRNIPAQSATQVISDFNVVSRSLYQGVLCPATMMQGSTTPIVLFSEISRNFLSLEYPFHRPPDVSYHRDLFTYLDTPKQSNKQCLDPKLLTRRSLHFCTTLQGYVVSCLSQSREMILSEDFSNLFVPAAVAHSWPSRTHEFKLDWTISNVIGDLGSNIKGCHCVIASIHGNTITLESPYLGPTVRDGHPRMLIKVNLIFKAKRENKTSNLLSKFIQYPSSVTSITGHKLLPYAIVGFMNDEVKILSSDIGVEEEEESDSVKSFTI